MEKQNKETLPDSKQSKITKADQEIIEQVRKNPDLTSDAKENIIATMEMYSGPIPHPNILAGYDALYKGAAKKIIDNGIAESEHRRKLESARQKRRGRLAWASMIILALICTIFMIGSFWLIIWLIMSNHKIIGSIFGGSAFVVLVGTFFNKISELTDVNDISTNKNKDDEKVSE